MVTTSGNNKRLAKNTLLLYFRVLLVIGVTLYTSRVVLNALGVIDFGIYNVVASMVSIFAFFQSSLVNVTQRYLNISLGKNNIKEANLVFNQSLSLYIVLALALVIIAELLGIWFIYHKLVIPVERLSAALIVFQFSLLTVCFSIIQIPFMSVIIARERMSIYAYLGIVEAIAKLLIVYLLFLFSSADSLSLYGGLVCMVSFIILLFHIVFCMNTFPECKPNFCWNKQLLKEMTGFIGYNTFGSLVYSITYQGIDILLNMFGGPYINAAKGVANQVKTGVGRLTTNLFTAVNPQIIKLYAERRLDSMFSLVMRVSKFAYFFIFLFSLPLLFETNFILNLWLEEVPAYAVVFTRWVLLDLIVVVFTGPWMTIIIATGKIHNINLYGRLITISGLPVSYFLLKMGFSILSPLIVVVFFQLLFVYYIIRDVYKKLKFSFYEYTNQVLYPILSVTLILVFVLGGIVWLFDNITARFFIIVLSDLLIGIGVVYLIGLSKKERGYINRLIKEKIVIPFRSDNI